MANPQENPIFNSPNFGKAKTLRGNEVSYISKKEGLLERTPVGDNEVIPLEYDGDKTHEIKMVEGGSDNNLPEMVKTIESGPVIELGYDGDKESENEQKVTDGVINYTNLTEHELEDTIEESITEHKVAKVELNSDDKRITEIIDDESKIVEESSGNLESEFSSPDKNKLVEFIRTIESGPAIPLGYDGDKKNEVKVEDEPIKKDFGSSRLDPEDIRIPEIPEWEESHQDDLNLAEFFRELAGNSTPEPALESVPNNLDEIMADWEKEMASGSESEAKPEKVEVVGEEFANTLRESFEEKKKETMPGSRWSFAKERLRGMASLGLYEFSSATKLWWNTNRQGKKIKKEADSLEEEAIVTLDDKGRVLQSLEEMLAIDGETKDIFSGLTGEQINDCFKYVSRGVVSEKIEKNNLIQEKIISDLVASFEAKFKNTKTYRGQKIGAEKIKEITETLQEKLTGVRTGRVQKDLIAYNKLIREKVDAEWYKRYVAGGIEMALASALIVYVKPLVAKNLSFTAMKAGSSTVRKVAETVGKIKEVMPSIHNVPMPAPTSPNIGFELPGESPTVTEALPVEAQEDVVKMKKTVWHTVKDYLKLNGVKNPTDAQIMEASKLVAETNDIGVKDWGIEGKNIDTKLKSGFALNMAGVSEMAVKWGGKKITREAWNYFFNLAI